MKLPIAKPKWRHLEEAACGGDRLCIGQQGLERNIEIEGEGECSEEVAAMEVDLVLREIVWSFRRRVLW